MNAITKKRDAVRRGLDPRVVPVYDYLCEIQPKRTGTAGMRSYLNAEEPYVWVITAGDEKLAQTMATTLKGSVEVLEDNWFEIKILVER
jgi:hypothetical protein